MRTMTDQWRRPMVAALVVLACLATAAAADAQGQDKQVLVLYSTRPDAQLSIVGERELPRVLETGLGRGVKYYSEFLDVATFPARAHVALHEFLRLKYEGIRFDLVVAIQTEAIEFLASQRDTLFRGTPAVFLSLDPAVQRPPDSTGLIHEQNLAATVGFLRQLQPDVRNLFVVSGDSTAADRRQLAVVQGVERSHPVLKFTYLAGLPTKELETRLSALPDHSAVYYLSVSEDGAGQKFHPLEYLDVVVAAANAPTYSWVDSTMGHGIVGGSLYRQKNAIDRVGDLALRVLRGEAADSIPITRLDLNSNMVDWRQLQRWRIEPARIPADTLVSFREPTIWDRYKVRILAAAAVVLGQAVLIAGLLIQRKRRRRAEGELRNSREALQHSFERIRDLGAGLLRAQETERARIARELHDDICQRLLLLTLDLESLHRANAGQKPTTEALTAVRDVATSLHELSHRLHPTKLRLLGLVAALEQLCEESTRAGMAITFTHDHVPFTLAPDIMLCFFRVVQEAVQNAIKYSSASRLSVHLRNAEGLLTLTIVDNGVGFDVDAAWGKGVGLSSMSERLEAIGGTLQIRSNPGSGTRLTAVAPSSVAEPTTLAG